MKEHGSLLIAREMPRELLHTLAQCYIDEVDPNHFQATVGMSVWKKDQKPERIPLVNRIFKRSPKRPNKYPVLAPEFRLEESDGGQYLVFDPFNQSVCDANDEDLLRLSSAEGYLAGVARWKSMSETFKDGNYRAHKATVIKSEYILFEPEIDERIELNETSHHIGNIEFTIDIKLT